MALLNRKFVVAGVFIVVVLLASVIGYNYYRQQLTSSQRLEQQNSVFYMGTTIQPRWMDNCCLVGASEFLIGGQVFEPFLGYDSSGKIIPVLADSLPTVSSDGLVWTMHLRQGITFQDGTPLTAQGAISEEFRSARDPSSLAKSLVYGQVDLNNTKALDQYTIEFHLFRPFSPMLSLFASPYMALGSPTHHDRTKDEYFGTGPWKFDHWTRDVEIVLTRNDAYWNKQAIPKLKTLVFKIYKEATTMELDFRQHVLDAAWPDVPVTDIPALKADARFNVAPAYSGQMLTLMPNERFKGMNNTLVRQALNYAVDRAEIITKVYHDVAARPQFSIMSPMFPEYTTSFQQYSYNPDKAKQLLTQAGYPNGLDLSLFYGTYRAGDQDVCTVLQQQLAKANIRVSIQGLDYAGLTSAFRSGKFELLISHWSIDFFDGANPLITFLANSKLGGYWTFQYAFYNTQADQLIVQMTKNTDPAQRVQLYQQLQQLAADQAVQIPIADLANYVISWKTVQNFQFANPFFATSWSMVTKTS